MVVFTRNDKPKRAKRMDSTKEVQAVTVKKRHCRVPTRGQWLATQPTQSLVMKSVLFPPGDNTCLQGTTPVSRGQHLSPGDNTCLQVDLCRLHVLLCSELEDSVSIDHEPPAGVIDAVTAAEEEE
ncbi:hypothetical protein EYF80_063616 [Liparis tanakae]|uniref:Uncharacterized protein n=1 Tax=Liparis tanakae TaxID=230148 RepID=A0A4Z2EBN0_9TELE|nr:hypothetical protein EYF80_063616 [Liparis tanakae]